LVFSEETIRENRAQLGVFVDADKMTPELWTQWANSGHVGTPPAGYVPRKLAPAGREDFPSGFTVGWRKLTKQPKLVGLSDEDALAVLEKLSKPDAEEQQQVYHSKVESAILAALIGAKQPLTRIELNRKIASDFPVSQVSSALSRLVRRGELSSYQQMSKFTRQRFYSLPR
jgi:hypothetical protein